MALLEYVTSTKRKYPDFCVKSSFSVKGNQVYAFFLFSPRLIELVSEKGAPVERFKIFYDDVKLGRIIFKPTTDTKNSFKIYSSKHSQFKRMGVKWELFHPVEEIRKTKIYEPSILSEGFEIVLPV